ncbi:hypothetical protein KDA00_01745 [Candidatus Saccharibacteria bacterium]|nr:hypothetical protein [Candidatus Saccharibacteria bacterium]
MAVEEKNKEMPKGMAEPEANWSYNSDVPQEHEYNDVPQSNGLQTNNTDGVSWTASEYIAHEKDVGWFLAISLAIIVVAGIVYALDSNHSLISPILIVIAGITFMVAANRSPRVLDYVVDASGIYVGQKLYRFSQFKSFSMVEEGPIYSINFSPLQRFVPSLTIYFDPKDKEKITNAISIYLPHEVKKQDPVDILMRKIRF